MKRNKNPTILILDDDSVELNNYFMTLKNAGYTAQCAQTLGDAWRILETFPINMVLSDIHLSRNKLLHEGLSFLIEVKKRYPHITLMAMSSDSTIDLADRARQAGAWTFIRKPEEISEEFLVQIRQGLDVGFRLTQTDKKPEIILNPELKTRIQLAIQNPDAAVIIEGETGTGKEEIVKYIHQNTADDHQKPLVSINCAQLRGELVLSTLFGHKKGAFTGAVDASIGAVGRANGGILFLDEFHRLNPEVQEMLLRTIQDGTYYRVGDNKEMRSYFRLFIALPKSLDDCAIEGTILLDLRFRLYGVEIRVPPLRERLDQLGEFIDLFFGNYDKPFKLDARERENLISRCSEFYWQGNIRQLFGVLNMLALQAQLGDGTIRAIDLPVHRTMLSPGEAQQSDRPVRAPDVYVPSLPQRMPSPEQVERAVEESGNEVALVVKKFLTSPASYDNLLDTFEKAIISRLIPRYATVKNLCLAIDLKRTTFDAKRRRLGL